MREYEMTLTPDDNDTFLVTSEDFPELTTFGETEEEALQHSVDALEAVIAARMKYGDDIPFPQHSNKSKNPQWCVPLSWPTQLKVVLYKKMREFEISQAELSRRLGISKTQVNRLLKIGHKSDMDQFDAAFNVIGCDFDIEITDRD